MVTLELESYNLEAAKIQLMRQCFQENPYSTIAEIAKLLGVSERTMYRTACDFPREDRQVLKARALLEKSGYTVTKK